MISLVRGGLDYYGRIEQANNKGFFWKTYQNLEVVTPKYGFSLEENKLVCSPKLIQQVALTGGNETERDTLSVSLV